MIKIEEFQRDYIPAPEIADRLGVTRQYVNQLMKRRADFPKPEANSLWDKQLLWKRGPMLEWIANYQMTRKRQPKRRTHATARP